MNFEEQRCAIQSALDKRKPAKERNLLGQFATPFTLASDIMKYVRSLSSTPLVSFLEPSMGTGVFYSAFRENFDAQSRAVGYEIDPYYATPALDLWKNTNLEIREGDFLSAVPDEKFSLIVANPPYSRHHHINAGRKQQLQNQVSVFADVKISGLAGMYAYFLILSTRWLKNDGISCWLIPAEFMDVNYGKAIKDFLLHNVELVSIHRFEPEDLQFCDALVTSSVVVFRNMPASEKSVRFTSGGSVSSPLNERYVTRKELAQTDKWSKLFGAPATRTARQSIIGDYFTIKRGIATGNNHFFIIPASTAKKYDIPPSFLTPVLPAPRFLMSDEVQNTNDESKLPEKLYLFHSNLQEAEIKNRYPGVWSYIEQGIENRVNEGFNCRNRTPWYSCETREPSPILLTYMGRSDKSDRLFRFILNNTPAIATNSYLLLYPKNEFKHKLRNSDVLRNVWCALNSIPKEELKKCGRVYGGGLYKIEPKELLNVPATQLEDLLGRELTLFD